MGAGGAVAEQDTDVLSGLFDDLPAVVAKDRQEKSEPIRAAAKVTGSSPSGIDWTKTDTLYVDIETVPDESRLKLFGLEPLPEMPARLGMKECGDIETVQGHELNLLKSWLSHNNPCDEFLDALRAGELANKKPRKGALDAIDSYVKGLGEIASAADDRRKLLSVTPEFCRIAAIGFGNGRGDVETYVLGQRDVRDYETTEAAMLDRFWEIVEPASIRHIVGFNVIGFDLPAIFIRSALLNVEPSRRIDLSPYRDQVVDLMLRRWPKGGQKKLKDWARMLGIDIPAGDCDGSQVAEMLANDPAKLRAYLASDISVTRAVHLKMAGFFW